MRVDDLIEFVLDALSADNLDPVGHALKGHESLVFDLEIQLRRKTDAAHHAQGVVGKGDARLQRGGDDAVFEVGQTIERIDEFSETLLVQADSHRIDGEITTVLIVFQRTVLTTGFPGVVTITLLRAPTNSTSYSLPFWRNLT